MKQKRITFSFLLGVFLVQVAGSVFSAYGLDHVTLQRSLLRLDNGVLRVEQIEATGALAVTDLRTGRRWEQARFESSPRAPRQRLVSLSPDGRSAELVCDLTGITKDGKTVDATFNMSMSLLKGQSDVVVRFEGPATDAWLEAAYPFAFYKDGEQTCNLYPHAEGLLVPVRKDDPDWLPLPGGPLYGGVRAYLMCLGLVDLASGEGLLTLLPSIESTHLRWRDWPSSTNTLVLPQLVWSANKGRFDRPYEVTWSFSDTGGYVALAKRYRQFFAERGFRKTLEAKAKENPAVREIAGAPVFWAAAAETPSQVLEMATILKTNGISRCLFALPVIYAPQALWTNEVERVGVARKIRSMGYLTYRYDQYRDTFEKGYTDFVYHQVNTEAFPDRVVRTEGQRMVQGFGPKSGVICPQFFQPMAKTNLPKDFSTYNYAACFLDCLGSVEFNAESECFDPRHPCDRFDSRREREQLLHYVNTSGRLAGTECGLDYLIPFTHWFEGATTLVGWMETLADGKKTAAANINDSSVEQLGKRLKAINVAKPRDDVPLTISQSTRYRIPFYSLCHHDEVMVTWRWEDGMNHPPVYWQRKNLWSVLYGAPPMYRPSLSAMRKYQREIGTTEKYVSSWVRKIAFEAMTSHRFLTTDRQVQETTFDSGRGVVVNFGNTAVRLEDGQEVPAMDYVTFQKKWWGRRAYQSAPCANVFSRSGL
ncbi:MAG: glycoside hydrolase [bacterium]